MRIVYLLLPLLAFVGCLSARSAIAPGHEMMVHNQIALAPVPDGGGPGSGQMATNEFLRGMMQKGITVQVLQGGGQEALMQQAKAKGFNYFMMASYTRYLPEKKYLMNQPPGQTSVYYQGAPIELSGAGTTMRPVTGTGLPGTPQQQILISNATVGMTAQMLEANTGNVIWTSAYTYEGVDTQQATEGTVETLLRSMPGPKK